MKAALLLCAALAVPLALSASPPRPAAAGYATDFDVAWRTLDSRYAYMDRAARIAWRRARDTWRPRAARAGSAQAFALALQGALDELRDDHVTLAAHGAATRRRVPAETDIWASWQAGAARVESIRTFGDADVAGLRPGHIVERISGVATGEAVRALLGNATASAQARDWALRHALAGPRDGILRLEVREGAATRTLEVERRQPAAANGAPLLARRVGDERDLGYIRFRHGLEDARLVEHLDAALRELRDTRALMLDLRDASGDGHRDVTRAILARFAASEAPWQLRETSKGQRIADRVAPRADAYRAPLIVLVDRWTAGEGEALAAGLVAVAHARLVGTPMAGLRGELAEVKLPRSGFVVRYPAQRVFHVDGTPREALRPHVPVDLAAPQGGPGDPILYQALKLAAGSPSPAPAGRSGSR